MPRHQELIPSASIFVANASGVVDDCGQGGGISFLVESAQVDDSGASVQPGLFPVRVVFDGVDALSLPLAGAGAVYNAPFERLKLRNCTPGGYYRVWVFRSSEQGLGPPSVGAGQRETLIMSAFARGTSTTWGAFYGPNNPTGEGDPGTAGNIVAGAFDLRGYDGCCLRASAWTTAANPPVIDVSLVEYPTAKAQQETNTVAGHTYKAGTCGAATVWVGTGAHGSAITFAPTAGGAGGIQGAGATALLGQHAALARKPGFVQPQLFVPSGWDNTQFAVKIELVGFIF